MPADKPDTLSIQADQPATGASPASAELPPAPLRSTADERGAHRLRADRVYSRRTCDGIAARRGPEPAK